MQPEVTARPADPDGMKDELANQRETLSKTVQVITD